ncbi:10060_t:CDS:1, partial [Racocetra fulgida]
FSLLEKSVTTFEFNPKKKKMLNLIPPIFGALIVPGIIVRLVQAIGFGTGGIAAGSFTARMMSLFGGGATARGSIVAILQSIGAAGLSEGAIIAISIV